MSSPNNLVTSDEKTKKLNTGFKKILSRLFNTRAAGIYLLVFAASIAAGTFIENDFGTSAAQKVIYRAKWFELLLLLFAGSLVYNIIKFNMIRHRRWGLLLFHLAMIIILAGAGISRYFGTEGMMHIREGSQSNSFLSFKNYFRFDYTPGDSVVTFYEPAEFASLGNNNWHKKFKVGSDLIEVKVRDFIPNPKQSLVNDPEGVPIIKIVVAGMSGRQEYFLPQGKTMMIQGQPFNFTGSYMPGSINISIKEDKPYIQADVPLSQMVMATRKQSVLEPGEAHPLRLRSMYSTGENNFVFGDFKPAAKTVMKSSSLKMKRDSDLGLVVDLTINGDTHQVSLLSHSGQPATPREVVSDGKKLAASYGARSIELPFGIYLKDFIMERYPGTNNPSSYASEVQVIDERTGKKMDYRIYMNHILNYGGYRFFQSSFDRDEKGTYLSVNHDFWGTWVSYLGYVLLTLGMLITLFDKKSRFRKLSRLKKKLMTPAIIVLLSFVSPANMLLAQAPPPIDRQHAELFSTLVVQDLKGRMKPMHTLSREILRKLSRKESIKGQTADQVLLGMFANSDYWQTVPMIKTSRHPDILRLLGTDEKLIAYRDFFDKNNGGYILRDAVRKAYNTPPADRGVFEKDLMKIDERVNVAGMAYGGKFFKLIPSGDEAHTWQSTEVEHGSGQELTPVAKKFFQAYYSGLQQAQQNGDYSFVNQLVTELADYQREKDGAVMPSKSKIKAEILLNRLQVFNRLALIYFFLGLAFLVVLFVSVFRPAFNSRKAFRILYGLALAAFLFHTLGLGLRWYVSGRAPWSNGYESMIYIAWTSSLAGIIFSRKSIGGMAATMILAATVLLVAFLSYLNPEITPLVPVLKSYWLTIHVSLEAGSYGFLMLGAIIGLINMLLMVLVTKKNQERVKRIFKELSYVSEMTLIAGLVMLSTGTYLGGVWANESWGRYWGWDPKETWALVTILVYAFILHMRIIPKLGNLFLYNVMTIVGWATVIMTYYGVNYYLSGLHSYATGDPVPIPTWVYVLSGSILAITSLAYFRMKKAQVRL